MKEEFRRELKQIEFNDSEQHFTLTDLLDGKEINSGETNFFDEKIRNISEFYIFVDSDILILYILLQTDFNEKYLEFQAINKPFIEKYQLNNTYIRIASNLCDEIKTRLNRNYKVDYLLN